MATEARCTCPHEIEAALNEGIAAVNAEAGFEVMPQAQIVFDDCPVHGEATSD